MCEVKELFKTNTFKVVKKRNILQPFDISITMNSYKAITETLDSFYDTTKIEVVIAPTSLKIDLKIIQENSFSNS